MRVLGKAQSINVAKVLWTCAELGIEVDREDWGSGHRPTTDPAFAALNPNAMVPVLIDGDFVLWESNAIIRYLANAHGGGLLYPFSARQRGSIDRWIDWQGSDLNASWRYAFTALVRRSPDFDVPKEIRRSCERWTALMTILDRQLASTGAYVAGGTFSLADIPIGLSVLRWIAATAAGLRADPLPHVDAYLARLGARPAFVRHGLRAVE